MKPIGFEPAPCVERPGDAERRREIAAAGLTLHGPIVPAGFVCNGCSVPVPPWPRWLRKRCQKVVDGRWRHACRIHDYEYHLLRMKRPGSRIWKNRRYQADLNFRCNIKVIIRSECKGAGHRFAFAWVSRTYFKGVRMFGRRAATGARWR